MAKKKEKIVEQLFRDDFKRENKRSALSRGLKYLENLEFHSVVFCESKDRERRERRILLLPRHMKSLLERNTSKCEEMKAEIERQKEENLLLSQVNKQLMDNIENSILQEHNRPHKHTTYSALIDDSAHQLKGLPFQGGLPGSGLNK